MKKNWFIICCLLVAIGAILLPANIDSSYPTQQIITRLQDKMETELSLAENCIRTVKEGWFAASGNGSEDIFAKLSDKELAYPTYLFINEKLKYWSDNRYNVSSEDLTEFYSEKLVTDQLGGIFLAKARRYRQQTALIVSLIPLRTVHQHDGNILTSGLNKEVFGSEIVDISLEGGSNSTQMASKTDAELPIYLTVFEESTQSIVYSYFRVLLNILALLLNTYLVVYYVQLFFRIKRYVLAFGTLALALVGFRCVMVLTGWPYSQGIDSIMSPYQFAVSWIAPSIGDYTINLLVIFIGLIVFLTFEPKILDLIKVLRIRVRLLVLFDAMAVIILVGIEYLIINFFRSIRLHSVIDMDYHGELGYVQEYIAYFLSFGMISVIFSVTLYLSGRLLFKEQLKKLYAWSILLTVITIFSFMYDEVFGFFILIIFISVFSISYINLSFSFKRLDYNSFLFIFICAISLAASGMFASRITMSEQTGYSKEKFVEDIIYQQDHEVEFELEQALRSLRDSINDLTYPDDIEQYMVAELYQRLGRFQDKYTVMPSLFSADERLYLKAIGEEQIEESLEGTVPTGFEHVHIRQESRVSIPDYISWIELGPDSARIGYVSVVLNAQQKLENGITPWLIESSNYHKSSDYHDFSYAVYHQDVLESSGGSLAYNHAFYRALAERLPDLQGTTTFDGQHHMVKQIGHGDIIVVSSPIPSWQDHLTYFSFYFLVAVFANLLFISFYGLPRRQEWRRITFTTKIQFYLNTAFLLPFAAVLVIVIGVLRESNSKETALYYLEKAENAAANIGSVMNGHMTTLEDRQTIEQRVKQTKDLLKTDINFYDVNGRLMVTSQPYFFTSNMFSKLINPKALVAIMENQGGNTVIPESIGTLNFQTAFAAVKSPETGDILGIVALPFYGTKHRFDEQLSHVISNVIKIFTVTFAGLLIVLFLSTKSLTKPLELIREKIRDTSFDKANHPIDYPPKDEFGLLVQAYNEMLGKLQDSRKALARSEKESAWREMARQVAHEIKNPLTPMKLSLQHLNRVLKDQDGLAKKPLNSLLTQVETLNDIATSFSMYATMPAPKEEEVDIKDTLATAAILHQNECKLVMDLEEERLWIKGDKNFLGRVFGNLIINGIQSVPEHREPEITISLKRRYADSVRIEVRDNGLGIPELYQNKVFVPDFTTKKEGSGIGLAISKRTIEHLGGNIWFETEIGIGTSFFIEMPLLRYDVPAPVLDFSKRT